LIAPFDTVVTAETPEGIEISIKPAGFPVRACAFLIDSLLQLLALAICSAVLGWAGRFGTGLLFVCAFAIQWFYPVVFELAPGAATPGKRALGLEVLMANGLPITPAGSLLRNLMRVVDFLPSLYACGIVTLLLRPDARRLGDLAAGTIVAYRTRLEFEVFPTGAPAVPQVALSERQQRALTAFATRLDQLTPERAEEIAQIALPVLAPHSQAGAAPSPLPGYLVALARWIHGERVPARDSV
jgi:uncharacterized RDD family membrane protein YckC